MQEDYYAHTTPFIGTLTALPPNASGAGLHWSLSNTFPTVCVHPCVLTCGIKLHNSESYQAGLFTAAPGARGITPPNLHTESQRMHLFITKLI